MMLKRTVKILAIVLLIVAAGLATRHFLLNPTLESTTTSTEALFSAQLPDLQGEAQQLSQWKGKIVVVNFWASWCVPCREEMPALDALATKYNSDAFMVLPINLDIGEGGLAKAQAFLDENSFTNLPLYADNTFAAFERLKQQAVAIGLPVTLVLDENGCELAVLQGPARWDTPDGEAVVEKLIALGT